jgi:hypothetical protein
MVLLVVGQMWAGIPNVFNTAYAYGLRRQEFRLGAEQLAGGTGKVRSVHAFVERKGQLRPRDDRQREEALAMGQAIEQRFKFC